MTAERRRLLGLVTALTLALVAGAVIGVTSLLDHTLTRSSEREAAQDAQFIAQVGFAAATSDGRLSRADIRTAHGQIAAARRTHDLGTVVVWDPAGRPLFTDTLGEPAPARTPTVVRRAIRTGRIATGVAPAPAGGRAFQTAVPVAFGRRRLFAEFEFSRDSVDRDLARVKGRIYVGGGLGGVVLFAALLPLTSWVAGRLPTQADRRREAALARLDAAIAGGELCLYFRPKLATDSGRLDGVEALVRWQHPERGLVPPGEFIPLLEHSHLVDRFTGVVVDAAAEACARWRAEGIYVPGACPGFGSCHLRLRRPSTERATLIFGDSNAKPRDIGLIDAFAPVMAPLLESIAAGGGALGRSGVDVRAFVEGVLRGDLSRRRGAFAPAMERHTLNDYIEAQVHGVVSLAADVDALVIDPAFAGTPTGELLCATAKRYGFEAQWHPGSALALSQVPQDAPDAAAAELMRWQVFCANGRARRLAERVVEDHGMAPRLDAASIGQAAVSVVRNPERWQDWGTPREMLQHLKDLWVIVVAHGEPLP